MKLLWPSEYLFYLCLEETKHKKDPQKEQKVRWTKVQAPPGLIHLHLYSFIMFNNTGRFYSEPDPNADKAWSRVISSRSLCMSVVLGVYKMSSQVKPLGVFLFGLCPARLRMILRSRYTSVTKPMFAGEVWRSYLRL